MTTLDLFVKTYGLLHNYNNIPYWALTPLRKFLRSVTNIIMPFYLKHSARKMGKEQSNVIVSFTSFPARIDGVWQVVESMLRQTYRPQKIYLWLSKEQFTCDNSIPKSLKELENNIFQIRLVDGDIRSHKKYYYVSQEFPDSLILLIDDDIYYPSDMIEVLIKEHKKNTKAIIGQYGYIIQFDERNSILPYKKWEVVNKASKNSQLFFGSGGGTLIKPSNLYEDLTKKELFIKLAPIADDIWLNAMARLSNTPIIIIKPRLILPVKSSQQNITLCSENVGLGRNDEQIKKVCDYYEQKLGVNPFSKH